MNPVIESLDRIDLVAGCIEAVGDLLVPEKDLHVVNRDKQALLLSFLTEELYKAREQLRSAIPR